jgi:hypothetical protein
MFFALLFLLSFGLKCINSGGPFNGWFDGERYKKVETRSKECYMKELTNMQDNQWSPGYPFYKELPARHLPLD